MSVNIMPRDVKTRWNSTYDMLEFAIEYRLPLDRITDECSSNLQDYDMDKKEWKLAGELRDILKVCTTSLLAYQLLMRSSRFSRTRLCSFHAILSISQQ
jgi:hypothetical protein